MLILGLSAFRPDTSAILAEDGMVTAPIETDKVSRLSTRELPEAVIEFLLGKRGCWLGRP